MIHGKMLNRIFRFPHSVKSPCGNKHAHRRCSTAIRPSRRASNALSDKLALVVSAAAIAMALRNIDLSRHGAVVDAATALRLHSEIATDLAHLDFAGAIVLDDDRPANVGRVDAAGAVGH